MRASITPHNAKAEFVYFSQVVDLAAFGLIKLIINPSFNRHKVFFNFHSSGNSRFRASIRFSFKGSEIFSLPINHDSGVVATQLQLRLARMTPISGSETFSTDYMESFFVKNAAITASPWATSQHLFCANIDKAEIVSGPGTSIPAAMAIFLGVFSDNHL